jgi:hypothetical protein
MVAADPEQYRPAPGGGGSWDDHVDALVALYEAASSRSMPRS